MRRACEGLSAYAVRYGGGDGPLDVFENGSIYLLEHRGESDGEGVCVETTEVIGAIPFCPFCGVRLPHPVPPARYTSANRTAQIASLERDLAELRREIKDG